MLPKTDKVLNPISPTLCFNNRKNDKNGFCLVKILKNKTKLFVEYIKFKLNNNVIINSKLVRCFNFWSNCNPQEIWFYPIFKNYLNYLKKQKRVINVYSVFGKRVFSWDNPNNVKIFFNGENLDFYTEYYDHCLNDVDLSIGFEAQIPSENYAYLPLWILYYFHPNSTLSDIQTTLENLERKKHDFYLENKLFCSLVASHDRNGIRQRGLEELNQVDIVHCGGAFNNNTSLLHKECNNSKSTFLSKFKFNMAFENSNRKFYTTEKIFDSLFAGTLPIYWGSDFSPEQNVLNQNRIIFFNGPSSLDIVRTLNKNPYNYLDFYSQNIFVPGADLWIYNRIRDTKEKIETVISKKLYI
jgi:hypothetical protein